MRRAGKIAGAILKKLSQFAAPGKTTSEIDLYAETLIKKYQASAAFKGYQGFPATVCVSLNEELIHGIPNAERYLTETDLVSIDLGIKYQGYYADTACSFYIGHTPPLLIKNLLEIGKGALQRALKVVRDGTTIGDIGFAIQDYVEKNNFCVVRKFVGHGIGTTLHEEPEVYNFGNKGEGTVLRTGMTIAIEPMITVDSPDVEILPDHWTVVSKDRKPCVHFEHTVLVAKKNCVVLTN